MTLFPVSTEILEKSKPPYENDEICLTIIIKKILNCIFECKIYNKEVCFSLCDLFLWVFEEKIYQDTVGLLLRLS